MFSLRVAFIGLALAPCRGVCAIGLPQSAAQDEPSYQACALHSQSKDAPGPHRIPGQGLRLANGRQMQKG